MIQPITISELAKFTKNGAYSLFSDESVSAVVDGGDDPLYLQVIQSRFPKAPINKITRIADMIEWESYFGKRDRKMERSGVFAWIHANWLLSQVPIYVLNLREYSDTQTIKSISLSVESGDNAATTNVIAYKDLFNRSKFWKLDKESLAVGNNPINFGVTSNKNVSIFVTKSADKIYGSNETVADYLAENPKASIEYIPLDTPLNDLLIDVWVFDRDLSADSTQLDPSLNSFVGVGGKIKAGKTLTELSKISASKFIGDFSGSLIPELLDSTGAVMFIESIINASSGITGVFSYVNLDEIQKYIDHDLDDGIMPSVLGYVSPNFTYTQGGSDFSFDAVKALSYDLPTSISTDISTFVSADIIGDVVLPDIEIRYNESVVDVVADSEIVAFIATSSDLPPKAKQNNGDIYVTLDDGLYHTTNGTTFTTSNPSISDTVEVDGEAEDRYYTSEAAVSQGILTASTNTTTPTFDLNVNVVTLDDTTIATKFDGMKVLINGIGANAFVGQDNKIATYTLSTTTWAFATPADTNTAHLINQNVDELYTYNLGTTTWVFTATSIVAATVLYSVIDVITDPLTITTKNDGDRYLVGTNAVGDFLGQDWGVAEWVDVTSEWTFTTSNQLAIGSNIKIGVDVLNSDAYYSIIAVEFNWVDFGSITDETDDVIFGNLAYNKLIGYVDVNGQFSDSEMNSIISLTGVQNIIRKGTLAVAKDGSVARAIQHMLIGTLFTGKSIYKTIFDKPLYSTTVTLSSGNIALDNGDLVPSMGGTYFLIRGVDERTLGEFTPKVANGVVLSDTQFVNATSARQEEIFNFMFSNQIKNGVIDRSWNFKWIVDSFKTYIGAETKWQITKTCLESKYIRSYISLPSVKDFEKSLDPSFTNANGEFRGEYITKGANQDKPYSSLFTTPSAANGDFFASWVGDVLIYNDGFSETLVPSNAAQVLNAGLLHIVSGKNVFDIPAGDLNGVIAVANATTTYHDWSDEDLKYLHPWGLNTIVKDGSGLINSNAGTGESTKRSQLSFSENAELLMDFARKSNTYLKSVVNNFRNTVTTRTMVEQKANTFTQPYIAAGALGSAVHTCDSINNNSDIRSRGYLVLVSELFSTSGIRIAVHKTVVKADV